MLSIHRPSLTDVEKPEPISEENDQNRGTMNPGHKNSFQKLEGLGM